jgi:hypothetical protein
MLIEKFGKVAKNVKDHTCSALFGSAMGGTATAIITAPTLLGYGVANSLGANMPISAIVAGGIGYLSWKYAFLFSLLGSGAVVGAAETAGKNLNVEPKTRTSQIGASAGALAALYMMGSLAMGDDHPKKAEIKPEQIKNVQFNPQLSPEM